MKNCLHTDCQQSTYAGCLHETMGNGINISDNTGPICANCGKLGHMGCTGVTNKPTWEQKIAAYGFLGTNLRSHDETKQFILDLLAEQRKEFEEKGKSLLDKLAEREDLPDTRLIDIGVGMRAIINLIKQK